MTTDNEALATTDGTSAAPPDALARLLGALAEDAAFALSCGGGLGVLEDFGKRRDAVYAELLAGRAVSGLRGDLDAWLSDVTRAMAPIHAPEALPMGDLLREHVTLEGGSRGLRAIFSTKPSEKDVLRVKRLGTLGVRVLRAVLSADGPLDAEDDRTIATFTGALGLPDDVFNALCIEDAIPVEQLDVYGDIEPAIAKALVRGAWFAAASDGLDPREELVIRVLANKLSIPAMDLEVLRNGVVERIENKRVAGLAAIDAIRFVLSDRLPELGLELANRAVKFLFVRCHRDEAFANIAAGQTLALTKRTAKLAEIDRKMVLGIAWSLAMIDDPSLTRRALLRARHERLAEDLREDAGRVREAVDGWMNTVLTPAARSVAHEK